MPARRTDRRSERTRRDLLEALNTLINQRSYQAIAVHDITRTADVGRSTFYSHFKSKEELLFSQFEPWLRHLVSPAAASPRDDARRFRFSLPFLRHIAGQKRFALATLVRGANVPVYRKTTAILVDVIRVEIERLHRSGSRSLGAPGVATVAALDARAHAVAGAFIGLVGWWLTAGGRLAAEEVDEMFQEAVLGISIDPPRVRPVT